MPRPTFSDGKHMKICVAGLGNVPALYVAGGDAIGRCVTEVILTGDNMKKLIAAVALSSMFVLAACDGPNEEAAEQQDDVLEAQGEVMDAQAGVAEAQSDLAEEQAEMATDQVGAAKMEQKAEAMDQKAETLEDTADGI